MDKGVIAFCGSKFSGKSTSYNYFKEVYTGPTEEIALAGHLKIACSEVFGIEHEMFINPQLKEVELPTYVVLSKENLAQLFKTFFIEEELDYNKYFRPHIGKVLYTPRTLLQYIGTEVLHPIDPLIHAKIVLKVRNPEKLTVLTDLRFSAEFDFFEREFGLNFKPVYVKNSTAETAASTDTHASETGLKEFKNKCYVLYNEGSLEELKTNITSMTVKLFKESNDGYRETSQGNAKETKESTTVPQN